MYFGIWLVSLTFILIKGDLVSLLLPDFLNIDLVTILLAHVYVRYGKIGGGIFALSQGFLIDLFSAGPLGLFTLLYFAVFLGLTLGDTVFDMSSSRSLFLMVCIVVFVKELLLVVLMKAFSIDINISSSTVWASAVSSVLSGVLAPIVFFLLESINQGIHKDPREVL